MDKITQDCNYGYVEYMLNQDAIVMGREMYDNLLNSDIDLTSFPQKTPIYVCTPNKSTTKGVYKVEENQ